ncbi:unnamed protein product [Paramecium sonneborni]|uniref:Uncharacterized protein n=1 Tax=Paramecium sonneborni TaxID=65129 RepID=A0A8S1PHQ9_9CILI|nr:unnamed protein product [Paramecium sonneborni]
MNVNVNLQLEEVQMQANKIDNLWKTFQKQIQNNQPVIVILLGSARCGKTTLFDFLKGSKFQLSNNNSKYPKLEVIQDQSSDLNYNNNSNYIDNPSELNFSYIQPINHLLLTFSNFVDLKNVMHSLVWEEFFLRLINNQYQIKIVYIEKHPETELQSRGCELQSFIKKYFGQRCTIFEELTIILNLYQEQLSDEELIESVQGELKQICGKNDQDLFVFRKIKLQGDLEKYFTNNYRIQILNTLVSKKSINLNQDQFTLDFNIINILESIFIQPFTAIINQINQEYNNNEQSLKLNDLQTLQQQFENLSLSVRNQGKNLQFWFDEFLTTSSIIIKHISSTSDQFIQYDFQKFRYLVLHFSNVITASQIVDKIIKLILNSCQEMLQNVRLKLQLFQFEQNKNTNKNSQKQQLLLNFSQPQLQNLILLNGQENNIDPSENFPYTPKYHEQLHIYSTQIKTTQLIINQLNKQIQIDQTQLYQEILKSNPSIAQTFILITQQIEKVNSLEIQKNQINQKIFNYAVQKPQSCQLI